MFSKLKLGFPGAGLQVGTGISRNGDFQIAVDNHTCWGIFIQTIRSASLSKSKLTQHLSSFSRYLLSVQDNYW